jgi:hypothetical protein
MEIAEVIHDRNCIQDQKYKAEERVDAKNEEILEL